MKIFFYLFSWLNSFVKLNNEVRTLLLPSITSRCFDHIETDKNLVNNKSHLAVARIEVGAAASIPFRSQTGQMFNEAVHVVAGDALMFALGQMEALPTSDQYEGVVILNQTGRPSVTLGMDSIDKVGPNSGSEGSPGPPPEPEQATPPQSRHTTNAVWREAFQDLLLVSYVLLINRSTLCIFDKISTNKAQTSSAHLLPTTI